MTSNARLCRGGEDRVKLRLFLASNSCHCPSHSDWLQRWRSAQVMLAGK